MGSSDASAVCLRAILRERELEVVGVVTQPDRPAGRGKELTPCPCKAFAVENGITEIITPENVNDEESFNKIKSWKPDVIAVVAFGQFLKKHILELPLGGCINCHFSLLPKYRGASPVVSALAAGEKLTGVSVMRMGLGMDDGPVLLQSYEPIYSDVTGGELMDSLAIIGGVTLAKTLKLINRNALPPEMPQNPADATFAKKLKKTDGLINWSDPVIFVERKIRAYMPWPGSYSFLPPRLRKKGSSGRISILKAAIVRNMEPGWKDAAPGTVLKCIKTPLRDGPLSKMLPPKATGPIIKCLDTALLLLELKPEGGSKMEGGAFLAGRPLIEHEDSFVNQ